jgi:hypothetical protein
MKTGGMALLAAMVALSTGALRGNDELKDPGKAPIGRVQVSVLLGTDGDPAVAGKRSQEVNADTVSRLQKDPRLKFGHYRLLGSDCCEVYRSYENWAQPLAPSNEVLVRFEAQARPREGFQRLDLELWLSRKKILKTVAVVGSERPLFVLGPEWRGGRMIIMVALASDGQPG